MTRVLLGNFAKCAWLLARALVPLACCSMTACCGCGRLLGTCPYEHQRDERHAYVVGSIPTSKYGNPSLREPQRVHVSVHDMSGEGLGDGLRSRVESALIGKGWLVAEQAGGADFTLEISLRPFLDSALLWQERYSGGSGSTSTIDLLPLSSRVIFGVDIVVAERVPGGMAVTEEFSAVGSAAAPTDPSVMRAVREAREDHADHSSSFMVVKAWSGAPSARGQCVQEVQDTLVGVLAAVFVRSKTD